MTGGTILRDETITIVGDSDVVSARRKGRMLAAALGFGRADQTRLATAISELVRNALKYAGGGACTMRDCSVGRTVRLEVVVEDSGPGIDDLQQAMSDEFSTSAGLGAGLPGTRRLVHEFDIESEPGKTRVAIAMVRSRK